MGYQGWVALSKDANVIRSQRPLDRLSRRVIVARRIPYFALSSGNLSAAQMVTCLRRARHRMEKLILAPGPAFVARVYKDGSVRIVPNALESD